MRMKICVFFSMIFGSLADLIGWNRVWNNVDSHFGGRTSLLRDPLNLDLKAQIEKFLYTRTAPGKNKQRFRSEVKKTQPRRSARNIRLRFYKETLGKIQ